MNWKEEVESIFQDLSREFLSEEEAREQLKELYDIIPEDELEEVYVKFDSLVDEVEERSWTQKLDAQWEAYESDDEEGLN
jgi:hypothetical protein